jgi:tRNA(fMet)-specific endonuclease VapC
VPEAAADAYANIKHAGEQQGLRLDENDLWIAATALALGATLVTRDSDFRSVEGLSRTDWTA